LHRKYHPIAMAFLRRMGVSSEELEDACQEVFMRCHRALASFRGESQFKTWFYRLCLTEATRSYRRQRLSVLARSVMLAQSLSPATTQLEMSAKAAARRVEEALAEMNDGDRSVFVLYELDGLSGRQVASLLGCPVATVWRRLHYSRRAFRDSVSMASVV
jgi:RNA polymerase sigma-70 factor (ECF subfamily)